MKDFIKKLLRLKPCVDCNGTGVIETGNNDLPCSCSAGNKAIFNVAGRGQVPGAVLKKERGRW